MIAAIYVARVTVPARYPAAFKATGVGMVTRSDIDKIALAYGVTGAFGGFGLALALGLGRRS